MGSCIFQVSKTPVTQDDMMNEGRYYDSGFCPYIADYVDISDDIDGDFERLGKVRGLKVDSEKKSLIIEDKKAYFEFKYLKFKECVEAISNISLDDFINFATTAMYVNHLKWDYEDVFGFYIDGVDYGFITLDRFVRWAEEGSEWYLGAVFEYHS